MDFEGCRLCLWAGGEGDTTGVGMLLIHGFQPNTLPKGKKVSDSAMSFGTSQTSSEAPRPPGILLSWEDFDGFTTHLAARIRAEGPPDLIVAMARGGLIPAVALSHQLGVRSMMILPVQRTTSDAIYAEKSAPRIAHERYDLFGIAGRNVLVVDDIAGTGQSLGAVLQLLRVYRPAHLRSLVYLVNRNQWESEHQTEPAESLSYIGREVRGWVIFPWEKYYD